MAEVAAGRWPESSDPDLRTHVEGCATCQEVVEVGAFMRGEYDALSETVRLPAAGQVWWRAAVRARMERAHAATRPVTWAQGMAAAGLGGAACAAVAYAWPSVWTLLASLTAFAFSYDVENVRPVFGVFERAIPYLLAIGACVLLAPIVMLYLALTDRK